MAKVFIGMPVYNGERFLSFALDSLISQSYQDWEILISDDASKDSTPEIIERYVKKDARIKSIKHSKNLGLFDNFKFTLEQVNAPYFMWAAQDDIWEKDYIATCINYFDNDPELGLVTTCNKTIDSFGRIVLVSPWMTALSGKPSMRQIAKYVLEPEGLGKCNLMYGIFKTSAVLETWKAFPQRYIWGQDYMFSLAAVARFKIIVDPKLLFKKRLGGFSSPQLDLTRNDQKIPELLSQNPKDQMFPFGRFKHYFLGHMEALKGTPYRALGATCLIARLPRSVYIHVKERSLKNYLKRLITKIK